MRKVLDRILESLACVIFLLMIIVSVFQILSRYIFKSPSAFSEEFLRFSIIWLAMLGIAYAFGKNNHLAITFLKDKLNKKEKLIVDGFFQIIYIIFALLIMTDGGINAVMIGLYQLSPALGISMGCIYLSLPIAGVIIVLYCILNILDTIKKYKKEANNDIRS